MLSTNRPWQRELLGTVGCVILTAVTLAVLHWMGRRFWCACGELFLWSGDIWTEHNSQHPADPYSITHIEHGMLFVLALLAVPGLRKRLRDWPFTWMLLPALAVEALWEVVENTPLVINRYRESTMAIGYAGDSVINSFGDIVSFVIGYVLATRLPWRWTLGLVVVMEVALLVAIRDNLTLNVLMLLMPLDAVRDWQSP